MDKDTPIELWKDVEHYEGIYQVSNLGRVKKLYREWYGSTKSQRGKFKKPHYGRALKGN